MINLNALKEGNRICVFIRHGEKNINDFGLTDKGIQDTITFAKQLCSINKKDKCLHLSYKVIFEFLKI